MNLTVSAVARKQIDAIKAEHALGDEYGLRIGVVKDEDGERNIALDIEEGPEDRDRHWDVNGVTVFCSPRDYLDLGRDLQIDFSAQKGGFVVVGGKK